MLSTHTQFVETPDYECFWGLLNRISDLCSYEATIEQKCILHNCRTGLEWKQFKLKIYATATYVAPRVEAMVLQLMLILILSGGHHLANSHSAQCIVQMYKTAIIWLPNETTT